MRHPLPLTLLGVAVLAAALGASEQPASRAVAEPLMEAWRVSVGTHQPGQRDAALAAVAGWSREQWDLVYPRVLNWSVIRTPELVRTAGAAAFWKRAALLHTDIAILEPSANEPTNLSGSGRALSRRTVRVPDGRFDGFGLARGHWEIARVLLDQLPSPQMDGDVLDWYRATAATLAGAYSFAELIPHLERARQLFSEDPAIHFNLGCLYEALAASRVQDVLATLQLPGNSKVAVDTAGPNLRRAEEHFERATARSAVSPEAKVRLAVVRLLLGRSRDAAEALRGLVRSTDDSWVRYHALMFLGRSEEAIGGGDRAREAYEQAAALFPGAQSPHLALASLDARDGRTGSTERLHKVLRLPHDSKDRSDPWTDYHRGEGRYAELLLEDLYLRLRQPSS